MLEPHQELVLEGALGERKNGTWAAFEVGVVEPRQNGKGDIKQARQLAGLYLFGEELQTDTAHRFDTSLEAFRRIRDTISGVPDLSRRVKSITEAHGQEAIELRNPTQRLIFKARSKGSGRGFSGDVVYLDEAFWLLELGAMLPTMSARPNPQLWYLSSAPLPRIESDILRRLCQRGRAGARRQRKISRLAYFEWCAEVGADPDDSEAWEAAVAELLDDPEALAQANPGLGYRITPEFCASERAAMTPEEYARERLGIYPDVDEAVDPVIPPADWQACEDSDSRPLDPVTIAFEVSVDRKWAVIAVAGPSSIDGTHVEIPSHAGPDGEPVVDSRRGTGWLVDRLVELRDRWKPAAIVCNPGGPAGALIPECEAAGLEIGIPDGRDKHGKLKLRAVTARDYAQACGAAFDDIVEHRWRHLGQPVLNKAVSNAVRRDVGDTWVFDRRSNVDISPLVAVTLAAWVAGLPPDEEPLEPGIW